MKIPNNECALENSHIRENIYMWLIMGIYEFSQDLNYTF